MTGAAIAQATRSYWWPYTVAEIAAQPCYVCAMPAAAQIGTCALDNRWVPLCEPCHRAWYKLARTYVGELGGTRHTAPSKAHLVRACQRCGKGGVLAGWTMWSGRDTLLCLPCDVHLNRLSLAFLDVPGRSRRIQRYRHAHWLRYDVVV